MKESPNDINRTPFFSQYRQIVEKYKDVNKLVAELKSEAMKPRHWKDLMVKLYL